MRNSSTTYQKLLWMVSALKVDSCNLQVFTVTTSFITNITILIIIAIGSVNHVWNSLTVRHSYNEDKQYRVHVTISTEHTILNATGIVYR